MPSQHAQVLCPVKLFVFLHLPALELVDVRVGYRLEGRAFQFLFKIFTRTGPSSNCRWSHRADKCHSPRVFRISVHVQASCAYLSSIGPLVRLLWVAACASNQCLTPCHVDDREVTDTARSQSAMSLLAMITREFTPSSVKACCWVCARFALPYSQSNARTVHVHAYTCQ